LQLVRIKERNSYLIIKKYKNLATCYDIDPIINGKEQRISLL